MDLILFGWIEYILYFLTLHLSQPRNFIGFYVNQISFYEVKKILFWSITVAFGGFLFGFDTAVISGAEQTIQKLWDLSDTMIG